jgi:hypothetical protein
MKWFGQSWGAHVCEGEHVATPVGEICFGSCATPIVEGDRGVLLPFLGFEGSTDNPCPEVPYHLACFMRSVFGVAERPKPEPKREPEKRLTRNAVQCKLCSQTIESKHRHDFVTCPCGNVSVDGGLDYTRRAFRSLDWIELSECEPNANP